jgi:hypothetical protein
VPDVVKMLARKLSRFVFCSGKSLAPIFFEKKSKKKFLKNRFVFCSGKSLAPIFFVKTNQQKKFFKKKKFVFSCGKSLAPILFCCLYATEFVLLY